jgi:predicted DNA-binding transcriptional regulator AlpA
MARPTLLTDEVREELEDALASGVPVRIAAASVGVSRPTVYKWISRGLVERRPKLRLVESESSAAEELPEEEKIERAVIGSILKAASGGDWRAAAWVAERRWPRKYARR